MRRLLGLLLAAGAAAEPSVAVATIVCGTLAMEALFGICVAALRKKGEYSGPVYALTDRPGCAPDDVTVVPVSTDRDKCGAIRVHSLLYKRERGVMPRWA